MPHELAQQTLGKQSLENKKKKGILVPHPSRYSTVEQSEYVACLLGRVPPAGAQWAFNITTHSSG